MIRRGSVVKRNAASKVVAICGALVFALSIVGYFGESAGFLVLRLGTYGFYVVLFALAHHFSWVKPSERPAKLRVEHKALWVDGHCVRAPGRLTAARVLPRATGGPMVEVRRSFDLYPFRIGVRSLDDARAVLRALGLDAREGATRFPMPFFSSPLVAAAYLGLAVLTMLVLVPVAAAVSQTVGPFAFPALLVAFALAPRFLRGSLTIGDEGLLFESRFRRRVVPFAEVKAMDRIDAGTHQDNPVVSPGFRVTLRSGEVLTVPTIHERQGAGMYKEDHVFEAAASAWASSRGERELPVNDLVRGERSIDDWLRALRSAPSYRAAAESDEQLQTVLADPVASAEERLGAAVRLRARGVKGTKKRVRVAAESAVTPVLREGLEAVAADDDAKLVALLSQKAEGE